MTTRGSRRGGFARLFRYLSLTSTLLAVAVILALLVL